MKICFVNSFLPPWRGGAETYTENLARHLGDRGHDVKVLASSAPLQPGCFSSKQCSGKRLRSILRIYGSPIMPALPFELAKMKADIVHANFPSPYIAFVAAESARITSVPAVLTWHNDLPPVTEGAARLVRLHDHLVLPRYVNHYRRIISTSPIYAKTSPVLARYPRKVAIIAPGVDSQKFNPKTDGRPIRRKFSIGEDDVTVGFVGALTKWHRYKGLDILLSAFQAAVKSVRNLRLLIVGSGDLEKEFREQASRFSTPDRIIFAGNVPDEELPAYYAAMDMVVLPSKDRSEGFGLSLLEGAASGKPIIGSSVGGIPSIVRHGVNGLLVPPNQAQPLSDAIHTLATNHEIRSKLGKKGRRIAEDHDWRLVAERTERLYYEVISEQL